MSLTDDQRAEIEASRAQAASTRRATVPALEEMLFTALPVLDHGFVRVIDYMGDDAAIVQAARVSYGRGTRRVSEDAGLIRYLMRHRHSTPFEMCEIKYHVKLPIFVARQWIRHRTANVNEYSARYSILDREFYIPAPEHLAAQSAANRQGRGDVLQGEEARHVLDLLRGDAMRTHDHYVDMLNEGPDGQSIDPQRQGLARELARMNLTLNTYTQWYWKTDLHNLLHFLSLRADAHAQYEIRAYAEPMLETVKAWVPAAYAAFRDYRLGAVTFSASMLAVLKRMLAGEAVEQKDSTLSKREWAELMAALERPGVITVFGSINLDLIFSLPHLPQAGETVLGRHMTIEPGGKGANQAVAAARDGAQVVFAGAVGNDALAGDALALMRAAGLDLSGVARADAATGCAAICVDPAGRNLIAVSSGANLAARQEQVEDALLGPGITVLLQRETEAAEIEALIRRARARGARIVLNLAPAGPIAEDALRALDVLVANEDEAAWLAGSLGAEASAEGLHARLGVDVVVTLGEEGVAAATSRGSLRLAARKVAAVDTTGAGDCFTGVLAAALDRGLELEPALRRANAAAGLCCTRRGTQGSMPLAAETDAALVSCS